MAVAGETVVQMTAEIAAEITPRFSAFTGKKILTLWACQNDIGAGTTVAAAWQSYQDYVTAVRAAHPTVKVIGFTLTKIKSGVNPTYSDAKVDAFNALMRASGTSVVDAIVDVGAAPQLQDPTDLTYWNADGVHPNNTGEGVIAPLVKTQLDAILALP